LRFVPLPSVSKFMRLARSLCFTFTQFCAPYACIQGLSVHISSCFATWNMMCQNNTQTRTKELLSTQSFQTPKVTRRPLPSTPTSRVLPTLPPNTPLPKEDINDYGTALEIAVRELQNDFESGARQLADISLNQLAQITELGASVATSWGESWAMMVHVAQQLGKARPSMSAAITSCLLRTLERIARRWNEEQEHGLRSTLEFANIAKGMLDEIRKERRKIGAQLGESFTFWLKNHYTDVPTITFGSSPVIPPKSPLRAKTRSVIRILTLSNSSTIRTAILHALAWLTDYNFHLTILESRPRCEGADMAAQILFAASDKGRLSIRIIPDCAVGTASRNIDIVLLGADRVSSTGDVSNKTGSLAAAMCAKQQNPNVTLVVVSDIDKIAASGLEEHAPERHPPRELSSAWTPDTRNQLEDRSNVEVFGEWFEWVPAKLVDVYVTELGVLELGDVERVAREIQELDEYIFQAKKE
jgi:translation initiation factor 2B subunit (eIF-2B alpha/beta/delta family)